MDEVSIRELLEQVADDQLPPVRVRVDLAASRGRRALRWRRIYLPVAAPVAAAAAVALIAVGTAFGLHAGSASSPRPSTTPASPAAAGSGKFHALLPFASFGWLPAGWSADGLATQDSQNSTELNLGAVKPKGKLPPLMATRQVLSLQLFAPGVCKLTGKYVIAFHGKAAFPHGLSCPPTGRGGPELPVRGAAPDVNGSPAYWLNMFPGNGIIWKYGPDEWADLIPARGMATSADLHKIASTIHFGSPIPVHYGFTISGLPAAWHAGGPSTSFASLGGRLVNVSWVTGPADDSQALSIAVSPEAEPKLCDFGSGPTMLIDGVRAKLGSFSNNGHKYIEELCGQGVRGMQVFIILHLSTQGSNPQPLPGGTQFRTMQEVINHLQILGADMSTWPTSPLR